MVLLIGLDFGWFQDKWTFWFFLWITDQSKTFRLSDGSFNRFGFQTVSDNWILTGFALDTGSKITCEVVRRYFLQVWI